MRIISYLLLCFPLLIFAQERSAPVPVGTEGNQLVLAMENASLSSLRDVHVTVRSAPAWIVFKTSTVVIDSIPSKTWRDAVFEFRVQEGLADQDAAVLLAITDAQGYFLGSRMIKMHSVNFPRETKLDHPYPTRPIPLRLFNTLFTRHHTLRSRFLIRSANAFANLSTKISRQEF